MLNTSTKYKEAVIKNGSMWRYKLTINSIEYSDFSELNYKSGVVASDSINIGESVSSYIDATILGTINPISLAGQKVYAYAGLYTIDDDDKSIEWVKLGVFNIIKPELNIGSISFTAYDNMYMTEQGFFTSLQGQQKISAILDEQCRKIGISYAGGDDGSSINVDVIKGITIRKVFELCASYCGKNAVMNRDGNLELRWFKDSGLIIPANIIKYPLVLGDEDFIVHNLSCAIGDKNDTVLHTGNDIGLGISFSNQLVTQDRLNAIYQIIGNFTYRACTLNIVLGRPDIEVGDIVTIEDLLGNLYKIPIFILDLPLDGGMPVTVTATAKTKQEDDFRFQGELSTKVERAYTESISAKEILAETIVAWSGKFGSIETDFLIVKNELKAHSGKFGTIESDIAILKQADIDNLTAINAKIEHAEIGIADITTIINRFTTSDSIHSLLINADTAIIADATIKNAMIDNLEFSKITGIDINTTNFKIHSKDGMSQWYDNTIQIKDSKRIRVQIGKDASSDYNMYIWDASGVLMFDAKGIKAAGIKDKIIRDDMVSDSANISGSKINITSLITEINNGSTSITSNRIIYDGKSLDVAFKTVTDGLNTVKTELKAEQGKISTLISDMSQSKEDISVMQSSFSSISQELGSIKITVSSHESSITGVTGRMTSLETNLNGFKSTVASTYATITTVDKLPADIQNKMLGTGITLPANADLNTFKTVGVWTTSNMSGVTNLPTGIQSGCELRLIVELMGSTIYLQQTLISTYAGTFKGAWRRSGTSTTWKTWSLMTDTSNVVSCINQTAESIKIQASKIDLTGYVTLTNLATSGKTTIDGGNIKTGTITASHIQSRTLESVTINSGSFNTIGGSQYTSLSGGSMKLKNDNVSVGSIGTNQLKSDSSKKGLDFDLEYSGHYMTWAYRSSASDDAYTMKFTYASVALSELPYANTIYLGCSLDTRNHDIWLDNGHTVRLTAFSDGAGFDVAPGDPKIYLVGEGQTIARFRRVYGTSNINFYGNLDMNGFNVINQSDARLKTNIKPSEIKGLETINQLNLVEFDWLTRDKHEKVGLVAQQLKEICPELVYKDDLGILGINTMGLIMYLIKSIQELNSFQTNTRSVFSDTYIDTFTDEEKQKLVDKYMVQLTPQKNSINDIVLKKDQDGTSEIYNVPAG